MKTMNQSLFDTYQRGLITFDDALSHSVDPDDFKRMCRRT